jgi:hypothetical protein
VRELLEKGPLGKRRGTAKDSATVDLALACYESEMDSAGSVFSPAVGFGMVLNITTDYSDILGRDMALPMSHLMMV